MYPDLIDAVEIGRSVEGRQILAVKLWRGGRSMIMVGSHHAREHITSAYLMKALMEYTKKNNFLLAASLHSKGEIIYWADEKTVSMIENQESIAQVIEKVTGYKMCPVSKNPMIYAAGYENWFRAETGRPAFCIELTPHNYSSIPHDNADFDRLVWQKAKYLGTALAKECLNLS